MRYAQRGGYTPAEQERRERVRLGTAERFLRAAPLVWCWDNLNLHLVRELDDFVVADLDGLVRIMKRKHKKIRCRPHLLDGCLSTGAPSLDRPRPKVLSDVLRPVRPPHDPQIVTSE